jgi:hypothetical protein
MNARLTQDSVRQALILTQAALANPKEMFKNTDNVIPLDGAGA